MISIVKHLFSFSVFIQHQRLAWLFPQCALARQHISRSDLSCIPITNRMPWWWWWWLPHLATIVTASGIISDRCPGLQGSQELGTTVSVRRLSARAPLPAVVISNHQITSSALCIIISTTSRSVEQPFAADWPRLTRTVWPHTSWFDTVLQFLRDTENVFNCSGN